MNILICNWRDVTHPWAGGAERHLHELALQWVKKGHKVTFITSSYPGAVEEEVIGGIEIKRFGYSYSSFVSLPLFFLWKLRSEKYDCVIDTAHGIPYFFPLMTRVPVVLIVHHDHKKLWQTEFNKYIAGIGIFLEQKVVPIVYRKSQIVTLSASEKQNLLSHGFHEVTDIPPGIDTKYYYPGGKKSKIPVILYLGRLRKYKRVDILIKHFPYIKAKVRNVKLVIVGDGQDRSRLQKIVRKKGLSKDIIFKGYVSEEEKRSLLRSSWVLAFTSLMEGWGLVAMEAAACSTPTVGFNVPGVRDAVIDGTSGILCNTQLELRRELIRVLTDTKLRNKLSSGSEDIASQYSWEKCANEFLKVINKSV